MSDSTSTSSSLKLVSSTAREEFWHGIALIVRERLLVFAKDVLKRDDRVALEATTNTWAIVDLLRPYVKQIAIGNTLKTKAIAEAKIKTDKVDAEVLAQLLRCEYLPLVWQPDSPTQVQRTLLTHRASLMSRRGRHKNQVQAVLARLMLPAPCKYLWSKKDSSGSLRWNSLQRTASSSTAICVSWHRSNRNWKSWIDSWSRSPATNHAFTCS